MSRSQSSVECAFDHGSVAGVTATDPVGHDSGAAPDRNAAPRFPGSKPSRRDPPHAHFSLAPHSLSPRRLSQPAAQVRLIKALSRREVEILEHASAGRCNKEIARHLGMGNNGVKFHLKNINAKLGARRRIEAVRIAHDLGLIQIASPGDAFLTIIVSARRMSAETTRVSTARHDGLHTDQRGQNERFKARVEEIDA